MQDQKYVSSVLSRCLDAFRVQGFDASLRPAGGNIPFDSLFIGLEDVGDAGLSLEIEHEMLPTGEDVQDGFTSVYILQTFVTIKEGVPLSSRPELLRAVARLNTQMPVGAFGVFNDTGVLYFKFNTLVPAGTSPDHVAAMMDIQDGLVIHQLFLFVDGLLAIANGEADTETAFRGTPLQ